MRVTEALQAYARRIRALRRASAAVSEPALAPAFQQLLEGVLSALTVPQGLVVVPEFSNPGVGRPDIALVRPGAPPRAFVELKAPAKPADPVRWRDHDKRQFERFKELPNWATCNFAEFFLFERAEEHGRAEVVPKAALDLDVDDARADRAIGRHDPGPFLRLLERLGVAAGTAPSARDAPQLAVLLAHSARLVRGIVRDRLAELHAAGNPEHALLQVRQEFRDVLYAHPEAAGYSARDFNELFSAAFAQTLAFGLLLVREGTNQPVGIDAWRHMPAEHPLMRTALRVLTLDEVVADISIGFDVMRDTVNSFAPEILAIRKDGSDPILCFYEDFLGTFDTDARARYGVYYTPVKVVRYMVAALDRALRDRLGTQGLRDPKVTILDPATGTGTFLLGIAERVSAEAAREAGAGMAGPALRNLTARMFGFELLVGPYAVAHYRLHHALRRPSEVSEAPLAHDLPRLGVYLADTLAEPGAAAAAGALGFVAAGIAEERREANRIKTEQPILAIIGNPPYGRLEEGENDALVGRWMDRLWDDLKRPVREAGHGNQLNTFPDLWVAFWRWAIWKLFEAENAPRRGVVALITNRKFLTGWPYAGLRRMLRERFDRIEIVDLRGDLRRGERAGIEGDQGVFNIKVGTAITIAIADGSRPDGDPAKVKYLDSWAEGRFSRPAKLGWLTSGADAGTLPNAVQVERGLLDDFRPEPFQNGEWMSLTDAFVYRKSGMKSGRDRVFVSVTRRALRKKVIDFFDTASGFAFTDSLGVFYVYRPLDRRWFYNDLRLLNRPGPELQAVWGEDNVCLYAMPFGTGPGPAVWCHGLLPDYHAFRGSYGGYAFPVYDRRPDVSAPNLAPALVENLGAAYGQPVTAEDVFDAILCLLSAASYTRRFAEDLEDVFPHVPFPAHREVFAEAVRLGREIRAVETFARPPSKAHLRPGFVRLETEPRAALASVQYSDGGIVLCADGSGRVTGLPEAVWNFAVTGYRVLPHWIESRVGLPLDQALVSEMRDVCGRIAELIDLFAAADIVLEGTLRATLTRAALGFGEERDADDGRD
ncbi:MAG: N-6 DNA methylase [Alphaproteobacteria bacterium]|nr:N-6 DNA methylase [Alphaproteobacteria bacterium]